MSVEEQKQSGCYKCGGEGGDDVRLCPACRDIKLKERKTATLLEITMRGEPEPRVDLPLADSTPASNEESQPPLPVEDPLQRALSFAKTTTGKVIGVIASLLLLITVNVSYRLLKAGVRGALADTSNIYSWEYGGGNTLDALIEPWPVASNSGTSLIVDCAKCPNSVMYRIGGAAGWKSMKKQVEYEDGVAFEYFKASVSFPAGESSIDLRIIDFGGKQSELTGWSVDVD